MAQIMTTQRNFPILMSFVMMLTSFVLIGCNNAPGVIDGKMPVEIAGKTYMCEIVANDELRELGLGKRESLAQGEGMLFSFPNARLRNFVMRDCLFDIDIIFLDSAGRIVAMHHMPVEESKREGESQVEYELRLAKYSSRYNAQYVIEINGGELEKLNIKDGDRIELDTEYLQSITK